MTTAKELCRYEALKKRAAEFGFDVVVTHTNVCLQPVEAKPFAPKHPISSNLSTYIGDTAEHCQGYLEGLEAGLIRSLTLKAAAHMDAINALDQNVERRAKKATRK